HVRADEEDPRIRGQVRLECVEATAAVGAAPAQSLGQHAVVLGRDQDEAVLRVVQDGDRPGPDEPADHAGAERATEQPAAAANRPDHDGTSGMVTRRLSSAAHTASSGMSTTVSVSETTTRCSAPSGRHPRACLLPQSPTTGTPSASQTWTGPVMVDTNAETRRRK